MCHGSRVGKESQKERKRTRTKPAKRTPWTEKLPRVRHSALCGEFADDSQLRDFAMSASLMNHTPISSGIDGPSSRE